MTTTCVSTPQHQFSADLDDLLKDTESRKVQLEYLLQRHKTPPSPNSHNSVTKSSTLFSNSKTPPFTKSSENQFGRSSFHNRLSSSSQWNKSPVSHGLSSQRGGFRRPMDQDNLSRGSLVESVVEEDEEVFQEAPSKHRMDVLLKELKMTLGGLIDADLRVVQQMILVERHILDFKESVKDFSSSQLPPTTTPASPSTQTQSSGYGTLPSLSPGILKRVTSSTRSSTSSLCKKNSKKQQKPPSSEQSKQTVETPPSTNPETANPTPKKRSSWLSSARWSYVFHDLHPRSQTQSSPSAAMSNSVTSILSTPYATPSSLSGGNQYHNTPNFDVRSVAQFSSLSDSPPTANRWRIRSAAGDDIRQLPPRRHIRLGSSTSSVGPGITMRGNQDSDNDSGRASLPPDGMITPVIRGQSLLSRRSQNSESKSRHSAGEHHWRLLMKL